MSPEGTPIQINTAALQSAVAQNTTGILGKQYKRQFIFSRIVNIMIYKLYSLNTMNIT